MTRGDESDDPESDDLERLPPDVPPDGGDIAGGNVLTPDDLDISESEYVEKLDDSGRYVVSPGGRPPSVPRSKDDEDSAAASRTRRDYTPTSDESGSHRPRAGGGEDGAVSADSPEAARTLLAEELGRSGARYGIDVVARLDGEPVRYRTVSNDVVATFEDLIKWYARHVADDTPADQVVSILLSEANLVGSQTPNLAQLLDEYDLERTDSIEALIEAISAETRREG